MSKSLYGLVDDFRLQTALKDFFRSADILLKLRATKTDSAERDQICRAVARFKASRQDALKALGGPSSTSTFTREFKPRRRLKTDVAQI